MHKVKECPKTNQQNSTFVIGKSEGEGDANEASKNLKGLLVEKRKPQISASNFSLQRKDLKSMKWKELQKLKKENGVKGTLSRDLLITAILEATSKIKLEEKLMLWKSIII